jgi:hypothetical protein
VPLNITAYSPGGEFTLGTPVVITVGDWNGFKIVIETAYEDSRYRCTKMTMTRRGDGSELPPDDLPDVPIAAFIQEGVYTAGQVYFKAAGRRGASADSPLDDHIEAVATIYKLADSLGDAPRKAVQDVLHVSTSTAARWIATARDRGLLPKATTGARAGRRPSGLPARKL